MFAEGTALERLLPDTWYPFVMMLGADALLWVLLAPFIVFGRIRVRFLRPAVPEIALLVAAVAPSAVWAAGGLYGDGEHGAIAALPPNWVAPYVAETLVVGLLLEEVLFRPLLQGALATDSLIHWHVLVGCLFCFSHLYFSEEALLIPGLMFIVGSVAFALRGSMTVPVCAHAIVNLIWVGADYLGGP